MVKTGMPGTQARVGNQAAMSPVLTDSAASMFSSSILADLCYGF